MEAEHPFIEETLDSTYLHNNIELFAGYDYDPLKNKSRKRT